MDDFQKRKIKAWFNEGHKDRTRPGRNPKAISQLGKNVFQVKIFFFTWITYEAYTCAQFQIQGVGRRNNQFITRFKGWFREDSKNFSEKFRAALDRLHGKSFKSMEPGRRNDPKTISDKTELKQVIDVIYRIRCNLIHGGKEVNNRQDMRYVTYASYLLYELLRRVLKKDGII